MFSSMLVLSYYMAKVNLHRNPLCIYIQCFISITSQFYCCCCRCRVNFIMRIWSSHSLLGFRVLSILRFTYLFKEIHLKSFILELRSLFQCVRLIFYTTFNMVFLHNFVFSRKNDFGSIQMYDFIIGFHSVAKKSK